MSCSHSTIQGQQSIRCHSVIKGTAPVVKTALLLMKEEDKREFGFIWRKYSQFIHRPLGLQSWSARKLREDKKCLHI